MKYEIVKDRYTKARGGSAKLITITCVNCKKDIFVYQKDGQGKLLRMYLDKFVAPEDFVEKLKQAKNKNDMQGLKCPNCGELLGVPMVYQKEKRLAFRLINNKIQKKWYCKRVSYRNCIHFIIKLSI